MLSPKVSSLRTCEAIDCNSSTPLFLNELLSLFSIFLATPYPINPNGNRIPKDKIFSEEAANNIGRTIPQI